MAAGSSFIFNGQTCEWYWSSYLAPSIYFPKCQTIPLWVRFRTAPGDDWSGGDDGVPRCRRRGIKALPFIPPAPPPTDLPITSSDFSPHRGQEEHGEPQTEISDFHTYRHEHDAVVCPAKLGDAVQKHCGHLLVPVFNKTENLEGETSHLTLPVLQNCRLWVFIAAVSNEYNTHTHICLCTHWKWWIWCVDICLNTRWEGKKVSFIWDKPFGEPE